MGGDLRLYGDEDDLPRGDGGHVGGGSETAIGERCEQILEQVDGRQSIRSHARVEETGDQATADIAGADHCNGWL